MEIFSQQIQKILKTFKHNLLNENCVSCFFSLKSLSIFVCQCICLVRIAEKNGKITLEHLFMLNEAALHVHKKNSTDSHINIGDLVGFLSHFMQQKFYFVVFCVIASVMRILSEFSVVFELCCQIFMSFCSTLMLRCQIFIKFCSKIKLRCQNFIKLCLKFMLCCQIFIKFCPKFKLRCQISYKFCPKFMLSC